MKKNVLVLGIVATLILNACKDTAKQDNKEQITTETVDKTNNEITTTISTDTNGKKLKLSFNNIEGRVTLNFNGETSELISQKPASGIWYKNNQYELRGKANDIELKKDGNVVFTHSDDIVKTSLKNKAGETLDMTFNNTTNTVKVYLNGGEQIELEGEKPASGIWYKNDQYELRGKGEQIELTKAGKTVFKN